MRIESPEEMQKSIERMVKAQCGPTVDLEDVRATLGSDLKCIAGSIGAAAAPRLADALSNAIHRLRSQVMDLLQVRGVVAMSVARSGAGQRHGAKELGDLLRAAMSGHAPVICAGVLQAHLDSDVQVQLWARIVDVLPWSGSQRARRRYTFRTF